jgi:hypothetical protein
MGALVVIVTRYLNLRYVAGHERATKFSFYISHTVNPGHAVA